MKRDIYLVEQINIIGNKSTDSSSSTIVRSAIFAIFDIFILDIIALPSKRIVLHSKSNCMVRPCTRCTVSHCCFSWVDGVDNPWDCTEKGVVLVTPNVTVHCGINNRSISWWVEGQINGRMDFMIMVQGRLLNTDQQFHVPAV